MDAIQFNELTDSQKLQWIYFEGEIITSIHQENHKISLYLLNDFYIEVFYDYRRNSIDGIDLMDWKSARLASYVDQIRLPKVLS